MGSLVLEWPEKHPCGKSWANGQGDQDFRKGETALRMRVQPWSRVSTASS